MQTKFFIHSHFEGTDLTFDENIVLTAEQIAKYKSKLEKVDPDYEEVYYNDSDKEDLFLKAEYFIEDLDTAKPITEEEINVLEKFIKVSKEYDRIDDFCESAEESY
jgi:hypothetical protein